LDAVPWNGKPHLLLYGFFGMAACIIVSALASAVARRCGKAESAIISGDEKTPSA
jgi:hypothetical protein